MKPKRDAAMVLFGIWLILSGFKSILMHILFTNFEAVRGTLLVPLVYSRLGETIFTAGAVIISIVVFVRLERVTGAEKKGTILLAVWVFLHSFIYHLPLRPDIIQDAVMILFCVLGVCAGAFMLADFHRREAFDMVARLFLEIWMSFIFLLRAVRTFFGGLESPFILWIYVFCMFLSGVCFIIAKKMPTDLDGDTLFES